MSGTVHPPANERPSWTVDGEGLTAVWDVDHHTDGMPTETEAAIGEAADHLQHIMSECEGHRFGEAHYDITLDDIYDNAEHARGVLLRLLRGDS